jgi:CRISPR/Cas system-associated endonuclease/helicase Cas3
LPPSNTVHIGELYVPTTEKRIGDFDCLYEHQIRAIESKSNVVVLDAPTGSGKTLAALARVMHRSTPAVFIYPTNALVKDQVEKIKSDLVKLGYSPNLIDEKYPQSSFERLGDGPIVDLIHATGETLEKIADERQARWNEDNTH